MVRRLIALLAVLLPAALLASCGFFFASPFPQHLAQVTNLRSMSGELPDMDSGQVILKVMNNGTRGFLFLQYRPPFDNFKLLVLDGQLEIVSRYVDDRGTSANRLGDLQLVQPSGDFVAGTISIDAAGKIVGPNAALQTYEHNLGFFTGVPDFRFFNQSLRLNSGHIKMTTAFIPLGPVTGIQLSSSGANYNLLRLYHDVPADTVAFYFKEDLTRRIEGVLYRAPTFDADQASYTYFLDDNPLHFTIDDVDPEHVHYTRDGTVIRSSAEGGDRRRLKLIGFDGSIKAEFPDFEHRTVAAFAAEGDHYYFLDLEERMLYRANTWW